MSTIPTNQGELSGRQIISSLMYSSYASNRDKGMKPERLALYFSDAAAMERRYQYDAEHRTDRQPVINQGQGRPTLSDKQI